MKKLRYKSSNVLREVDVLKKLTLRHNILADLMTADRKNKWKESEIKYIRSMSEYVGILYGLLRMTYKINDEYINKLIMEIYYRNQGYYYNKYFQATVKLKDQKRLFDYYENFMYNNVA